MTIIVSKRVQIPKTDISIETIKTQLIIEGKKNDIFLNREPMILYKELKNYYIVPAIFGMKYIKENNLKYQDLRSNGESIDVSFIGSLRENQISVVNETIDYLKTNYGTILNIPCGFGKTVCANKISCEMGLKTIILVHNSILLNQWVDRISQFIKDAKIGIIQQNKFDIEDKTHVIASMQTLCSRHDKYDKNIFNSFGLCIIDETHVAAAQTLSKSIGIISSKYKLGLSATVHRKDGFEPVLFRTIGEIGVSIERDSNSQEINVEFIHLNFESEMKFTYRQGGKSTPNTGVMINDICSNKERNDCIIKSIHQKIEEGRHILVISDRRNHITCMSDKLSESGFKDFGFLLGGGGRLKIDKNNKASDKQVIFATYSFVSEGVDIPSLDTIIFTTPRVDIVQSVGRILRKHEGKKTPVAIDFIDTQNNVFNNQYKKRKRYYKSLGAEMKIYDENLCIIKKARAKKVCKEEENKCTFIL